MRSQKPPDSQPSWYPPKCRRCGKGSHPRQYCPARDSICHRCNRKGHYAPQCLSKTVAELVSFTEEMTISDQDSDNDFHSDTLYLNTVSEQQADTKKYVECTGHHCKQEGVVIVDTGTEVTAMSDSAWESLQNVAGKLTQSKQRLCGPDHQPLKVLETVNLTLSLNGKSSTQRVFIVKNLRNNLLGLPAIIQLQLLSQVDVVQKGIPDKSLNYSLA